MCVLMGPVMMPCAVPGRGEMARITACSGTTLNNSMGRVHTVHHWGSMGREDQQSS